MSFIHDDFLLDTEHAKSLFHDYAKSQPIIDYHCHLIPEEVATDRRWDNLGEMWLGGDHYKWRAMRAHGIDENLVTGDASWKEKFLAYAATVPHTLRNPLYHWTHLELKRYFDIDLLLSPDTAEEIWESANAQIASPDFTAQAVLTKFDVQLVGTTDDPCDDLEFHQQFADSDHSTIMVPTFRPDKAMACNDVPAWNAWIDRLSEVAGNSIDSLESLLSALAKRHEYFHSQGCRLSDHGIAKCPYSSGTDKDAALVFDNLRRGAKVSTEKAELLATKVLQHVGRLNAARGWTMQLHLGALRGTNSRMTKKLGPDTGYDSLYDHLIAEDLNQFLDSLDQTDELPKTILYNVNPCYNYPLATTLGNFQDGKTTGKMQFGSGWWHLDTLEGMTQQIEALSSVGLLSHFVGMLTDSRSFLSYPRHEYFRRLLCNILGNDIQRGLVPNDLNLVGDMVRRISFGNARDYFGFEFGNS